MMTDFIFKLINVSSIASVLLFILSYSFLFNFRHNYNKKKYGLIKSGLEDLQKIYDKQYDNPSLPAYLIQPLVNECLTSGKYNFKIIFFLMKNEVVDIIESAKEVNRGRPFLKVIELENNKIELQCKYSLENIKKWNNLCLSLYVFLSVFLIISELTETYIKSWITLDLAVIIVFVIISLMALAAFFGRKFTSIIILQNIIIFKNENTNRLKKKLPK